MSRRKKVKGNSDILGQAYQKWEIQLCSVEQDAKGTPQLGSILFGFYDEYVEVEKVLSLEDDPAIRIKFATLFTKLAGMIETFVMAKFNTVSGDASGLIEGLWNKGQQELKVYHALCTFSGVALNPTLSPYIEAYAESLKTIQAQAHKLAGPILDKAIALKNASMGNPGYTYKDSKKKKDLTAIIAQALGSCFGHDPGIDRYLPENKKGAFIEAVAEGLKDKFQVKGKKLSFKGARAKDLKKTAITKVGQRGKVSQTEPILREIREVVEANYLQVMGYDKLTPAASASSQRGGVPSSGIRLRLRTEADRQQRRGAPDVVGVPSRVPPPATYRHPPAAVHHGESTGYQPHELPYQRSPLPQPPRLTPASQRPPMSKQPPAAVHGGYGPGQQRYDVPPPNYYDHVAAQSPRPQLQPQAERPPHYVPGGARSPYSPVEERGRPPHHAPSGYGHHPAPAAAAPSPYPPVQGGGRPLHHAPSGYGQHPAPAATAPSPYPPVQGRGRPPHHAPSGYGQYPVPSAAPSPYPPVQGRGRPPHHAPHGYGYQPAPVVASNPYPPVQEVGRAAHYAPGGYGHHHAPAAYPVHGAGRAPASQYGQPPASGGFQHRVSQTRGSQAAAPGTAPKPRPKPGDPGYAEFIIEEAIAEVRGHGGKD